VPTRAERFVAAVAAVVCLSLPGGAASADSSSAAAASSSLRAAVVRALAGSTAAQVGVGVDVAGLGRAVDVNGLALLPPASTQKLYTAGAALLTLGPQYRLHTSVRANGADLTLVGGGDPTLVGDDLQRLAYAVAGAGITHVTGGLYGDDTRYDRARDAPGWKPSFLPDESGPLSAIVVDGNRWRRDAAFLADPTLANVDRFRIALQRAGVTVDGPSAVGPPPAGDGDEVAGHDSPPLAAIVSTMLKQSDNFEAELVLKELGTTIGQGTANGGMEVVWRMAESFGLPRGQSADGSGLSAHDREAPWHEVDWLRNMAVRPMADYLRLSLPLACGDGTLQQRFCATAAAGRVFAKTGSLDDVTTLAGYTTTASGRSVAFSFELAGASSTAAARAAVDRAVVAIVTFAG
jgi:serine-type D-Ala-D-Ala carboxypeptidase/endopeptidase (penicillin-binding protein 4)